MIRRCAVALTVALLVSIPALGCASDDEASAPNAAAADTTGNADTGALGAGIENLQDAQAELCPELSDVEADLAEVSASGTEAGQDVLDDIGSFAAALETRAADLAAAGAADAATAAENLAAGLQSLSTSGGEDARALAGEAAAGTQQLADALQCP